MKRIPLVDLDKDPFDVVVIGAGINGSGAVQELAAHGFRVLIIDKGDFSSGATNRSSRILHCGLRHLAPGKSVWDFVRNPKRFSCHMAMPDIEVMGIALRLVLSPAKLELSGTAKIYDIIVSAERGKNENI